MSCSLPSPGGHILKEYWYHRCMESGAVTMPCWVGVWADARIRVPGKRLIVALSD
jgi:hypothetical protein